MRVLIHIGIANRFRAFYRCLRENLHERQLGHAERRNEELRQRTDTALTAFLAQLTNYVLEGFLRVLEETPTRYRH